MTIIIDNWEDRDVQAALEIAVNRLGVDHYPLTMCMAEMEKALAASRSDDITKSILDIPCGTGRELSKMSLMGMRKPDYNIVGADITDMNIALCRSKHPQFEYVKTDIRSMPFRNLQFAVSLCVDLFQHLPEARSAIAELLRVSERVVFQTWLGDDIETPNRDLWDVGNGKIYSFYNARRSEKYYMDAVEKAGGKVINFVKSHVPGDVHVYGIFHIANK